jgi:hypothetical protein
LVAHHHQDRLRGVQVSPGGVLERAQGDGLHGLGVVAQLSGSAAVTFELRDLSRDLG